MKKFLITSLLVSAFAVGSFTSLAADKKSEKKSEYALKTCVVSDEKLGDMGKPYVFKHEGREVQLCCESCKKDFKKNPAKYMKKLDEAEKAARK
jgi:YHS domain-containing protein